MPGLPAELQHLQDAADPFIAGGGAAAPHAQPQFEVVPHIQMREQGIALKHHPHPATFSGHVDHLRTIDANRPLIGVIEPGDQTQGRAFPTAAGPKQSDAFAVGHIEVELVENLSLAEALVDGPKLQCHPLMAPLVSPLTIWR